MQVGLTPWNGAGVVRIEERRRVRRQQPQPRPEPDGLEPDDRAEATERSSGRAGQLMRLIAPDLMPAAQYSTVTYSAPARREGETDDDGNRSRSGHGAILASAGGQDLGARRRRRTSRKQEPRADRPVEAGAAAAALPEGSCDRPEAGLGVMADFARCGEVSATVLLASLLKGLGRFERMDEAGRAAVMASVVGRDRQWQVGWTIWRRMGEPSLTVPGLVPPSPADPPAPGLAPVVPLRREDRDPAGGQPWMSKRRTAFAEWVKRSRIAADWSQGELAQRAGVSTSLVCRVEMGDRATPAVKLALVRAFGVHGYGWLLEDVGPCIRAARQRAGLSQEQLGDLVGVSGVKVSLAERGKLRVRAALLARVVRSLRLTEDDLFPETETGKR